MANTKLQIAIEASNNATGQLKSLQNDLQNVTNATDASGMSFGRLVGAIGLGNIAANAASSAMFALEGFLKGTVSAAAESQSIQAQLGAVLKSTGEAAGVTADMANNLALKLSNLTTFSDEQVTSGENLMLTFTHVSKDVFPAAMQAALDVSQALGTDLQSAVLHLGKALNNPATGLLMLTRIGVSFTEQQKEQIKTLAEAGKTMDAQKLILQQLSKEYGGSAAAAADTYEGKVKQLDNSLHEVQKNIGNAVLPALDLFVTDAVSATQSVGEATSKNDTWARSFYSLASGAKAAGYVLEGVAYAILTLGTLLVGGAVEAIAFATDVVKSFQRIGDIGKDVFSALAKAMTGDFSGAKDEMAKAFNTFDLSGFHSTVQEVNKTLGAFAGDMENSFIKAGQAMNEGVVQSGFRAIQNAAPVVKQQLEDSVGGGASKAASKAAEALQKISDQAKETQTKLADVIQTYTQKSSDQLDAYNQKMADITGRMSSLQDDFAKSNTDKEAQYQDERLNLYVQHVDKLKQLNQNLEDEKNRLRDMGATDDLQRFEQERTLMLELAKAQGVKNAAQQQELDNLKAIDAQKLKIQDFKDSEQSSAANSKLAEIQKEIDDENAILQRNTDLKTKADEFQAKDDLQKLQEKHQAAMKVDQEAYDDKMAALKKEMQKEEDAHKEQTEKLKEETIKRFDTLLQEYQKGYEKLIAESKAKHAELLSIESEVKATVQAIQDAQNAIKASPVGSAAVLPHMAEGGVVTRPTVALIGESGPEAVIPLNRTGGMPGSQPVSVSIMEGAVIHVSNQADETRLAKTVAKELAKVLQGNRYGLAAQM